MNFIGRLAVLVGSVIAICLALWLSLTLVGVALLVGGGMVLFIAARQFLVSKGILNPKPGVPLETPPDVTVIDGEFKQIDKQ